MKTGKVPGKLYHAAPECVLTDIDRDGLKSNWGEIYAAGSPADALTFMWFRLLDHAHHQDGKLELVAHGGIYVWEIQTGRTNKDLWVPGTDHSTAFFGEASSWAYLSKEIKRSALTNCLVFTREVIESALEKK